MKKLWAQLRALWPLRQPVEYQYKWVRTHLNGEPDEANVLGHERSGWAPVPGNKIPKHLAPERTPNEKWLPNGLLNAHERNSYGGLRLYRLPKQEAKERESYLTDLSAAWGKTDQTLDSHGGFYTGSIDHSKGSLRSQIDDYYSAANRAEHPERQQEYETSERNLAAKGLSW